MFDDEGDNSSCLPSGCDGRVGVIADDEDCGGGGGATDEMGGRLIPLMQLLEQTLKFVPQVCMHWFQYWV